MPLSSSARNVLSAVVLAGFACGCAVSGSSQLQPTLFEGPHVSAASRQPPGRAAALRNGSVVRGDAGSFEPRTIVLPAFNDVHAALGNAELAVSDSADGLIKIYLLSAPHTLVGELTGLKEPQGLAVDSNNDLYVANTGAANVLVFAPGATTPYLTLDDSGNLPVSVAVDSDGTVYVVNIQPAGGLGDPTRGSTGILVYAKGATRPSKTLSDPSIASAYFAAIGPEHQVYTTYFDQTGAAQVGTFAGSKFHSLHIRNYGFAGGIKINGTKLLVIDQNARALFVLSPPQRYPSSFVPFYGATDPIQFDYGVDDTTFWVSDQAGSANHYALSGTLLESIAVGGAPIGIVALRPKL